MDEVYSVVLNTQAASNVSYTTLSDVTFSNINWAAILPKTVSEFKLSYSFKSNGVYGVLPNPGVLYQNFSNSKSYDGQTTSKVIGFVSPIYTTNIIGYTIFSSSVNSMPETTVFYPHSNSVRIQIKTITGGDFASISDNAVNWVLTLTFKPIK